MDFGRIETGGSTMQIKDRVFIVTGASSGIGLSTAIALSERGAKVALLARSTDALQNWRRKLPGSLPVTVDMTQFDRCAGSRSAVHRITAASTVS
jgi:NADP-dependent 3-hydroxy acid dehydrogenase YdfG